jgi:transposase
MYDTITKAKCLVDYQHFSKTLRKVSKNQGVSKSTIQRWVSKDNKCKKILEKRKVITTRFSATKKNANDFIEKVLETNPFITMTDLAKMLKIECNIQLSGRTVQRYTTKLNYTYKKAVNVIDHNHDKVQVRSFCTRFEDAFADGLLYSADEAGIYVGDHPRKGRSKRGKRLAVGSSKTLRKTKFSLVMVVGVNGIAAFEVIDHNYKKPDFLRFFSNMNLPQGSLVVMDNLRAHHSPEVRNVLANKGIGILFSPPYSPRCNPIEKVFGALKPMYRKQCHLITSTNKEEYKNAFIELATKYKNTSFETTFANTLLFLRQTIHQIDTCPDFEFIGYDIPSFVRLNVGK